MIKKYILKKKLFNYFFGYQLYLLCRNMINFIINIYSTPRCSNYSYCLYYFFEINIFFPYYNYIN